jgi:hypothetical protein
MHKRSRIAHMRNFSKLCDLTASTRCSPLPQSSPALASPKFGRSLTVSVSRPIARKSIEPLTHERDTQRRAVPPTGLTSGGSPSTHQRSRIAHMRNFSKLCDLTASTRCSPFPLSSPALASPKFGRSPTVSVSRPIARKLIEPLAHEWDTQNLRPRPGVAQNRYFGATNGPFGVTKRPFGATTDTFNRDSQRSAFRAADRERVRTAHVPRVFPKERKNTRNACMILPPPF